MNSATQILAALDQLDAPTISALAPRRLTVDSQLGEWELVVEKSDDLACALQSLAVAGRPLKTKSSDQLKQLSEQIAAKLQYLLEPIALIECDLEEATMQVRSDPPTEESDRTRHYYELLIKPSGLSLKRYTSSPQQRRTSTAMHLTRETLRRLCNDLDDAMTA